MRTNLAAVLILLSAGLALGQQAAVVPDSQPSTGDQGAPERWNLYYQATSIGQYHGTFPALYSGPLSLQDNPERDVSLTTTLFFGLRLDNNTALFFNPEIAGGKGFSNVDGIANSPNGEIPRVASATPKPYIARLYIQHDFGWGKEKEKVESDENQLAGERPVNRYTIYAGRFTLTDYFDDNTYSHDPRSQFMTWGVMYNGAWDYPADTRGYTWGIVQELHTTNWAFRYGVAAEPKVANGSQFDRRLFRDQGQVMEAERRYSLHKHPGAIRLLEYFNRADAGDYGAALKLAAQTHTTPDVVATRQPGTLKYGTGLNFEQEIANGVGIFSRLGWNDGKTESFAFTAIDRLATLGVSVKGTRWKRKDDVVGTSFTAGGLSGVHASYLAAGGLDFLIGDGKLNYAPEYVWESYYNAHVAPGFYTGFDVQHVANPAYNQDRGPVWVASLRLHMEFGVRPLQAK